MCHILMPIMQKIFKHSVQGINESTKLNVSNASNF